MVIFRNKASSAALINEVAVLAYSRKIDRFLALYLQVTYILVVIQAIVYYLYTEANTIF